MGDPLSKLAVLGLVRDFYTVRADHERSVRSAEQYLALAQRLEDAVHTAMGHAHVSIAQMFVGRFASSLSHVGQMLELFDRQAFSALGRIHGRRSRSGERRVRCLYLLVPGSPGSSCVWRSGMR